MEFTLELFNQHAIIESEGLRMLVDTGSPVSVHLSEQLMFCGEEHACATQHLGVTPQSLSEMVGTEITTLLGADVLAKYVIRWDYPARKMTFSEKQTEEVGSAIVLEEFMGIPIVEVEVDGNPVRCFLDSGATLSYLPPRITQGLEQDGEVEDFYPGVGTFSTPCYAVEARIGDLPFVARVGNLPSILQLSLKLGRVEGIIGYDFFVSGTLSLDLANKRLILEAVDA
jgi:hypothetical protein